MKKIFFILLALVALVIVCLYVLIPGTITISKTIKIEASRDAIFRKLQDSKSWKEWWPGDQKGNDTSLVYLLNDISFIPGPPRALSIPLTITTANFTTHSELTAIAKAIDSTTIHIETAIPVSNNPFKRIATYFKSKKLEKSLTATLQSLHDTYSKTANLYGYDIQKKLVVDSILVFLAEETKGYPSVDKVYSLIDELKDYIRKHSASETGFPMQNIFTVDSVNYLVKVAIPVNKKLPDSERIHYRWMLGGGNILITEVKGGPNEINHAYREILNYITDYKRIAPAIPFESLVTDRRKEPDSSKWVTRIYYPVM